MENSQWHDTQTADIESDFAPDETAVEFARRARDTASRERRARLSLAWVKARLARRHRGSYPNVNA
jgi:hypothetical protein